MASETPQKQQPVSVNLITYNNSYGLTQDVRLLKQELELLYDQMTFKFVNFYDYKCENADINIFLEIVNPILTKHAKYNILIPNQEWYYKTWKNYINTFDYILVKTQYAKNIFESMVSECNTNNNNVIYIGWKSVDKKMTKKIPQKTKTYLHVCGRSKYKQTQSVINNWKSSYPQLTIIYSSKDVNIIEKEQDNITYITERLSDEDLSIQMNKNFYHICCSETEGYGHYINEAKSCGSLVITTNAPPMNEFISDKSEVNSEHTGLLVNIKDEIPVENAFGKKYIIDNEHFCNVIEKSQHMSVNKLSEYGHRARLSFFDENAKFIANLKTTFDMIINKINSTNVITTEIKIPAIIPSKWFDNNNEELPSVSIVTLAYNRKRFFKLSLLNYMSIDYPKNKLEWIIIDDSNEEEKIKDLLPNRSDIHYYEYNEHLTIGNKRNIGVEKANNKIVCFMDDDDYYPPLSVKTRVASMLHYNKPCVTCTSIGCFHINKLISMINVPPHPLAFEDRISEASLAFTKKFWERQKFNDKSMGAEGHEFMKGRENESIEISCDDVIVSLLHNSNTSTRVTVSEEVNGCHFGFSDKLFLFITNLDKQIEM